MDWFLCDRNLRHERVNAKKRESSGVLLEIAHLKRVKNVQMQTQWYALLQKSDETFYNGV